jgi:hypothetical protein
MTRGNICERKTYARGYTRGGDMYARGRYILRYMRGGDDVDLPWIVIDRVLHAVHKLYLRTRNANPNKQVWHRSGPV